MAVYQYFLGIIPRQGIEKKHDSIPNEIRVYTDTGFFESDAEIYWKEVEMKADDIVTKIDLLVNRAHWGSDQTSITWKTESNEVDNDASIDLDEETLQIREFSFRADLREKNLRFLKDMIDLGVKNQWLFFDRKGKIIEPEFEEIKISIRNSNAYSFLENPIKFLENIDKLHK